LEEGDRVSVAEGGFSVVEFRDGCRYTVEGGTDYIVNSEQCLCYESLDASKHSRHDAVAELRGTEGKIW